MKETWKPIIGYEGFYEVSDLGRVRSIDRIVPFKNSTIKKRGRVLVGGKTHNGYRTVLLSKDSKPDTRRVHVLVLEHFTGVRPPGMVARHLDSDRTNNRIDNLEWSTQKENLADRIENGTAPIGENNPAAVLTEIDVRFIKYWFHKNFKMNDVAKAFGVPLSTVGNIKYGKNWNCVEGYS